MAIRSATLTKRKPIPATKEHVHLISRGWEALVEKLGYADATRFVMLLDKGSGDSVKYFHDLWKNTNAEEIYGKMIAQR